MNPVQDQLMNALFYPMLQMFLGWLPLLIGLVVVVILRDLIVAWEERKLGQFIGGAVDLIKSLFGVSGVSEAAIRQARGSRRRSSR